VHHLVARIDSVRGVGTQFGYSVYRRVIQYYSGEEDAFGAFSPSARAR